LKNLEKC